ncbi:MAG: hypothetical protein HGA62_09035 [Chlorobiaceae bacterium]|nr:hypothetical protein [Chlorobiaceae bacterium]NTV61851.1 hypothetical protein [Chlorobiaceae bacterium]
MNLLFEMNVGKAAGFIEIHHHPGKNESVFHIPAATRRKSISKRGLPFSITGKRSLFQKAVDIQSVEQILFFIDDGLSAEKADLRISSAARTLSELMKYHIPSYCNFAVELQHCTTFTDTWR